MTDRIVRYIITGDSAGAIRAFRQTEVAAAKTEGMLHRTGKALNSAGTKMSALGYSMTKVGIPLLLVGGYAVKSAMQFETSMTKLQTQAHASAREVSWLGQQVKQLGKTGFDANELATALYPIESDGFRGAKALEVLKAAAAGAQISGAGLEQTANALGGAMRTNLRDVHSSAGAMRLLNSIVGLGKMRWEDLNGALSSGFLQQAHRVGLGLTEIGDAVDSMTRKSVPAQQISTRLQKTLIQFSAVTGQSKKALKSIGIGQFDLAKDMNQKGGLIIALRDLREHLSKVGQYKGNAIIAQAFGRSKGAGTVGGLLEALPEMEKIHKEREKFGSLNDSLSVREKNASFKVAVAISNLKNAMISLGQVLIPVVIPALVKIAKMFQDLVEKFKHASPLVRELVLAFAGFVIIGGPVMIFLGAVVKSIGIIMAASGTILRFFGLLAPAAAEGAAAIAGETAAFKGAGSILGRAFLGGFAAITVGAIAGLVVSKLFPNGIFGKKNPTVGQVENAIAGAGPGTGLTVRHGELEPTRTYGHTTAGPYHGPGKPPPFHLSAFGLTPHSGNIRDRRRAAGNDALREQQRAAEEYSVNTTQFVRDPVTGRTYYFHPGDTAPQELKEHIPHLHLYLDGKEIAHNTSKHIRNHPHIARPVAEGVNKHVQDRRARE